MLPSDLAIAEHIRHLEVQRELGEQANRHFSPCLCRHCGGWPGEGMQHVMYTAILNAEEPFEVWGDGLNAGIPCYVCNPDGFVPDEWSKMEWESAVLWAQFILDNRTDYLAGREMWQRGYEKGQNNG